MKRNVNGEFRDVSAIKRNVNGVFKDVQKVLRNVDGVFKEVWSAVPPVPNPVTNLVLTPFSSGLQIDFSLPSDLANYSAAEVTVYNTDTNGIVGSVTLQYPTKSTYVEVSTNKRYHVNVFSKNSNGDKSITAPSQSTFVQPILPVQSFTGDYVIHGEPARGYAEFLSSGTVTINQKADKVFNLFMVGGGTAGDYGTTSSSTSARGRGGNGGSTKTVKDETISNTASVTIGAGSTTRTTGGSTSINEHTAEGGNPNGSTGSGGGGAVYYNNSGTSFGGIGGTDGADGGVASGSNSSNRYLTAPTTGQNTTTRMFEDSNLTPYAAGGGGSEYSKYEGTTSSGATGGRGGEVGGGVGGSDRIGTTSTAYGSSPQPGTPNTGSGGGGVGYRRSGRNLINNGASGVAMMAWGGFPDTPDFTLKTPTNVRVISDDGQVTLVWDAPEDLSTHLRYYIVRKSGSYPTSPHDGVGTTVTETEVKLNLTNEQYYYFSVYAVQSDYSYLTSKNSRAYGKATPFVVPTYTGDYELVGDATSGYLKLKSSGTLTLNPHRYHVHIINSGYYPYTSPYGGYPGNSLINNDWIMGGDKDVAIGVTTTTTTYSSIHQSSLDYISPAMGGSDPNGTPAWGVEGQPIYAARGGQGRIRCNNDSEYHCNCTPQSATLGLHGAGDGNSTTTSRPASSIAEPNTGSGGGGGYRVESSYEDEEGNTQCEEQHYSGGYGGSGVILIAWGNYPFN